jgi:GT2 family glycosyltransferase
VVVENGSRDGVEDVVGEIATARPDLRLRYMHVEWGNKSHALNEALTTICDELVVFFDDDVRLSPGVLEAYAEAASGVESGLYYGGPFGVDYEERPAEWLTTYLPLSARGASPENGEWVEAGWFLGFNWAAFTQDLLHVGMFDTDYGPGAPSGATGQESDMQRRLKEYGVRPGLVPGALVWHYVPKQRCTPQWVLGRKYRAGLETGLRSAEDSRSKVLWNAGRRVVRSVLTYVNGFMLRDRTKCFSAKVALWREVGLVLSCFARWKRDLTKVALTD